MNLSALITTKVTCNLHLLRYRYITCTIVIFGLFLVEEKSLSLRMLSSFILICRNQSTVELSEATFVLTQPSGHKRIARSVGSLTQANFTFESHTHTHTMKKKKKNGND
ncbi:hypothetical protein BLOT_000147 [Blomia tropicalis]|nr:hypothetical protein BLOT_000147 [Blomia tropicalis]